MSISKNRSHVKESLKVASPLLFSLLLQNLINVVDTIFLGRVGEVELGASALAGVFYMALYYIGFGFGIGLQALISRRNGEGNYLRIGVLVWQSILFLTTIAAVLVGLTHLFASFGFGAVISSQAVYHAIMSYLDVRVFGILPAFITIVYRSFFVGIKKTNVLIYSAIAMTITNVILNYFFIFGGGIIEPMGIKGAALSSAIAEFVGMLFYLFYTKFVDISIYSIGGKFRFNSEAIGRILNVSIWTMLQYFGTIFVWFIFFVAVEQIGERALAIANVIRSIGMLLFVFVSAFATSSASLVGNAIGERRLKEIKKITQTNIALCYFSLLPILSFAALFPEVVLSIFTNNIPLISDSVPALYVLLIYSLVGVPGSILFNIVSGTGNTKSSLVIELVAMFFYVLAIYFVILSKPVIWVCWTLEILYWGTILTGSWLYMTHAKWWKRRI
ncbi:MAG: MATE family efflux transporter [Phocaeicola sp.]